MGAGHSADCDGGAYASDPPARNRRKAYSRRRRHSVDSVASYSSQNHVDRIRAQNFSATSCQDEGDFGSIRTSLFRRSVDSNKRPESVTSNTSSTRSRLRELVERKSSQDEHKSAADSVGDLQYFENPTETLEFNKNLNSLELRKNQDERPKKRKLSKSKEKGLNENKNKKHEKYQSKLADYYKVPIQLPQDEFYQHLTRSKAAEELLHKRFANSDTEFSGSYGRLCKHKEPEGSNLRRSRSLAVIREETFTDLQLQNHTKNKRSQLIPRARLFDKPCFKDRLIGRAKYQTKEEVLESIYIDSTASCFGDINAQRKSPEPKDSKAGIEDSVSRNDSHHSRSISGSWPNLNDEVKQTNLSEDSIGHSRNPSEIDSLDSNYVRKHYNFEAHRKSYKDSSPETERSIASPNLSKDLYITTDENCSDTEDRDRSTNNTRQLDKNDNLSHCENDKNELLYIKQNINDDAYDVVSTKSKPSEIKENTDLENNFAPTVTKIDEDIQSVVSENDEIVSSPADSITSYISISIASSDKSQKLEFLANSLAEKIDEYCDFQFKENSFYTTQTVNSDQNIESEPIYTQVNTKETFTDIKRVTLLDKNKNLFNEVLKKQNNEVYVSNTYIESDTYSTKSTCTSKNITTEPFVTTLIENQYYSLPDINIGKCLRKSERIDAQLRQEDTEDIPGVNTYEIAQTHFREILDQKANKDYEHLNKLYNNSKNNIKIQTNNCIYLPDYSDLIPEQSFTKLEDDLKSIITDNSSNTDDKEVIYYNPDNHQNEREVNEIEGTIRNNKVISKSESVRLNSVTNYRPEIKKVISLSNDNINIKVQGQKSKTGIKKHYSLRQREPFEDENHRIPSPNTVEKSFAKLNDAITVNPTQTEESKQEALISRVQSFKTSADSNITIVPLSGHQTIVIDPPVSQISNRNDKKSSAIVQQEINLNTNPTIEISQVESATKKPVDDDEKHITTKKRITESCVDTSSYYTPKDPFITIKLNKVVKTVIPKFKKVTCEKIASVQHKYQKPPPKLIIKDPKDINYKEPTYTHKKINSNMTRPQVLQVVDSKSKSIDSTMKTNTSTESKIVQSNTNSTLEENVKPTEEIKEIKSENNPKEKLNNAIKTDIEYQEKLCSVKNYWSKLIEKTPENKDNVTQDIKLTSEDFNNNSNTDTEYTKCQQNNNDTKYVPEVSVGSIIKSLESVRIVDTIRKGSQTKLQLWKEETEKVKSDSEIEEPLSDKIEKVSEETTYNNPKLIPTETDQNRDTPEIEIVELSSDDDQNKKTQATLIKAKSYEKGCDEFDHVRYKVMKSELFKNSMIANYRKEAQFDGLLQYLQDYSFQELLVNNNIVIIEPVRTKVEPSPRKNTDTCKIPTTLLKKNDSHVGQVDKSKNAIRRHFFYHPIRVNKEIIEEELPNPDTVKKVRNLFEDTLKMKAPMTHDPPLVEEAIGLTRRATSYRNLNEDSKGSKNNGRKKVTRQLTIDTHYGNKKWDNASLSSGVSSGDLSSNNEYETDGPNSYSQKNLKDNVYSSSDEYLCDSMSQDFCCESQYVSPDILKKIRECGTSVTYYGGKVLNSKTTISPMTKAIMEEIKNLQKNCSRDCYSCQTKCRGDTCSCLVADKHKKTNNEITKVTNDTDIQNTEKNLQSESFPGFKFKLVKSNSCSSRLELTGTDDNKNARNVYRRQFSKEDPPLLHDHDNSVKNRICRLESYSKGITKTPFDNKDNETKKNIFKNKVDFNRVSENVNKNETSSKLTTTPIIVETNKKEELKPEDIQDNDSTCKLSENSDKTIDPHSFEKKFYYVNDNLDETKAVTGKFGEMVFEEFEVLESCYDSLNSNKSLK